MIERRKIGLRDIRAMGPGQTIWDAEVRGFGARRQKSAAVVYFCRYRTLDGRQRVCRIGRHGSPWTPDAARADARSILFDVADGKDPADVRRAQRKANTVVELCDQYLDDADYTYRGLRLHLRAGLSLRVRADDPGGDAVGVEAAGQGGEEVLVLRRLRGVLSGKPPAAEVVVRSGALRAGTLAG